MTDPGRLAAAVDDHLVGWVLLAVGVGYLVPALGRLRPLTTPLLAVMVGSVSLTLSPAAFRRIRPRAVALLLLAQPAMPLLAFGVARLFGLDPALTVGFVVLGAVTPELVSPVMTELGGGDTALSTVVLVLVGGASLALVPGSVALLVGEGVSFEPWRVVRGLLVAVVGPMLVAVGLRARTPDRVGRYDRYYPSVSALMVVLVIGIVTAANAGTLRTAGALLWSVALGGLVLNLLGYGLGWLVGLPLSRDERVAALFSVGMRDFAVAAGVVVAAGFPAVASLPAVAFGVVEMTSSALLARLVERET